MSDTTVNRSYKDSLFRMIFREKKELLSLYNAINGTHYEDPEQLTITTLDDVIYIRWKDDVSFLIQDILNLYEHQSTQNPNMPLRGLFYFSDLYKRFFHDRMIYSTRLLRIPSPVYVIFYNGESRMPDTSVLKLSDAFMQGEDMACLEVRVRMLNINAGHNTELMGRCRRLEEYAVFIERVRENLRAMEPAAAIRVAMEQCIEEGILAEFLSRRRAEVMNALLTEYDEEKVMKSLSGEFYEDGYEAGKEDGRKAGLTEGIRIFVVDNLEEGVGKDRIISKIEKRFSLSKKQAEEYFAEFSENFVKNYL